MDEQEQIFWEMINFELGETLEYLKDKESVWQHLTDENKALIIQLVRPSAFGIFSFDTGHVYGYYRTKEDAESILAEQCDDTLYVDELSFTEM